MSYDALGIAGSSMSVARRWIDATSDNIANINTITSTDEDAFQARYMEAAPLEGGGVTITRAIFGSEEGRMVHQPDHPLADEEGYVRAPDIDLGSEMTGLIMAQRQYQAAASVIERAKGMYESGLQIGK